MISNIRTKGISLSAQSQEYVEKKLLNLKKYYLEPDTDAWKVDISVEKNTAKDGSAIFSEVRISIAKQLFIADAKSTTVEEGIDMIHDKLKTQLQRARDKMKDHHAE